MSVEPTKKRGKRQIHKPPGAVFDQLLSCVRLFVTLWTAARQASLSFTISQSLLTFMLIESVMLSNPLTLCHPLLLLPSVFLSIRVFSKELALCISCNMAKGKLNRHISDWVLMEYEIDGEKIEDKD